jgi:hypothetical protein
MLFSCAPHPSGSEVGGRPAAEVPWDWDGLRPWNWADDGTDGDAAARVEVAETPPPGQRLIDPVLSVSVNGRPDELRAFHGWPLIVRAGLFHPRLYGLSANQLIMAFYNVAPSDRPGKDFDILTIHAKDGTWSGAARLEVKTPQGQIVNWPFHLTAAPPGDLQLNPTSWGRLVWLLGPEETGRIPAGRYELTVMLDNMAWPAPDAVKPAPPGPLNPFGYPLASHDWKGAIRSAPIVVHIDAEPSALPADAEEDKHLLLAEAAQEAKDPKQAEARIDELLARQPKSVDGLTWKGDLLAAAGKTDEAFDAYDRAVNAYVERNPDAAEPPVLLLRKRHEMMSKPAH